MLFNGIPADVSTAEEGCVKLGIDNLKSGIVARGILLDFPRLKGVPYLEPGTPTYIEDIEAWEAQLNFFTRKTQRPEMSAFGRSPYREIPPTLVDAYTLGGIIPVANWYLNDSNSRRIPPWTRNLIDGYLAANTIENIRNRSPALRGSYGTGPIQRLTEAFLRYEVTKKQVACVGSRKPWIESVLLNLQNDVTTVEYNPPACSDSRISIATFDAFSDPGWTPTFDAIVSFSSLEHFGLGRYGDPLSPFGDVKAMGVIKRRLQPSGVLVVGFPCGPDTLVWNAHRIYGRLRYPLVTTGYRELEWQGTPKEELFETVLDTNRPRAYQPVITLRPTGG